MTTWSTLIKLPNFMSQIGWNASSLALESTMISFTKDKFSSILKISMGLEEFFSTKTAKIAEMLISMKDGLLMDFHRDMVVKLAKTEQRISVNSDLGWRMDKVTRHIERMTEKMITRR